MRDLTPRQAAAQLGTSEATVRKLVKAGVLRAYRLGESKFARYRITPEAVEAFRNPTNGHTNGHAQ